MKLKSLLLAGLLTTVGVSGVQAASVFSVNAVGYVSLTIPNGFSMIANQLDSGDNTLNALLPTPPVGTKVFKWNGTGFDIFTFASDPFGGPDAWTPNGSVTLNPGEGAFISNPGSAFDVTFVGEVKTGSGSNMTLPAGFSLTSSVVPQGGALSTGLGYPATLTDRVFKFNGEGYDTFTFSSDPFGGPNAWTPSEPSVQVGEAFFAFKAAQSAWDRNFSIDQ